MGLNRKVQRLVTVLFLFAFGKHRMFNKFFCTTTEIPFHFFSHKTNFNNTGSNLSLELYALIER